MKFFIRWLISAITFIIVAYLFASFQFDSFTAVLIAAIVLGIINAIIRPIVLILTLPINIVTLGLFTLVINAFMLWIVHLIVPGFEIAGFWAAIWGGIIFWIVNWFISLFFKDSDKD